MKKYYKTVLRTNKEEMISCTNFPEKENRRTYKENEWTTPAPVASVLGYWLCVFTHKFHAKKFAGSAYEVWICKVGKTKKIWPEKLYFASTEQMKIHEGATEECWQNFSVMTDKVKLIRRIK